MHRFMIEDMSFDNTLYFDKPKIYRIALHMQEQLNRNMYTRCPAMVGHLVVSISWRLLPLMQLLLLHRYHRR